jgi:16S rRNA (guanine527-N7)-methyltransferase
MEKATENLAVVLRYFNEFTSLQLEQLASLDGLYREWNSRINVISRKDIDGLYLKHVLHSLSIAAATSFRPDAEVLDIGTGGGFPGIPLAIFFPSIKFHLVDSIAKKLKVVEAVIENLRLGNVTVQHTRAEEIKNRTFDYVVSRAVAPLEELWRYSRPLLRSRTYKGIAKASLDISQDPLAPGLICLKGGDLREEIETSKTRPLVTDIHELFPDDYFREKYLLYVPA